MFTHLVCQHVSSQLISADLIDTLPSDWSTIIHCIEWLPSNKLGTLSPEARTIVLIAKDGFETLLTREFPLISQIEQHCAAISFPCSHQFRRPLRKRKSSNTRTILDPYKSDCGALQVASLMKIFPHPAISGPSVKKTCSHFLILNDILQISFFSICERAFRLEKEVCFNFYMRYKASELIIKLNPLFRVSLCYLLDYIQCVGSDLWNS